MSPNHPPKKVGVNRGFKARWASQPLGRLLLPCILTLVLAGEASVLSQQVRVLVSSRSWALTSHVHPCSELTERNSSKTSLMFRHECKLKVHVQNLEYSFPIKMWPNTTYFWHFSTTSQVNSNFNGKWLWNQTWYGQLGKGSRNYKRSPTTSQNFMKFGPQMAYNWTIIFTHCQYSASLPATVYAASGITVAPHSVSKWNGFGLLCSSGAKSQKL